MDLRTIPEEDSYRFEVKLNQSTLSGPMHKTVTFDHARGFAPPNADSSSSRLMRKRRAGLAARRHESAGLCSVLVTVGVVHAQLHRILIDPVGDVGRVGGGDRDGARVVHASIDPILWPKEIPSGSPVRVLRMDALPSSSRMSRI